MIPFNGFTPDQPDLNNTGGIQAKNVFYDDGHFKPWPTLEPVSLTLGSRVLAAVGVYDETNGEQTFAATDKRLWRISGLSWVDVSKGGVDYGEAVPTTWGMIQFHRNVFATNFADPLQYVEVGSISAFADVPGSFVPKAKRIGSTHLFLIVGDIDHPTDGHVPHRLRWSAIGDGLDWPDPGTADAFSKQAGQQDLDSADGAVRAIAGTEYAIILQEKSITRMSYVGSPLVFQFDRVDRTRGCLCPNGVGIIGNRAFFIAPDGFYVTDGSGEAQPIGAGRVDKYFLGRVDTNNLDRVVCNVFTDKKLVIWSFPVEGGNGLPSESLIFNYQYDRWTWFDYGVECFVRTRFGSLTLEDMDVFGNTDAQSLTWDSEAFKAGRDAFLAFGSDHRLAGFTGDPGEAVMETGEVRADMLAQQYVDGVLPLVERGEPMVSIGFRRKISDPVQWTNERMVHPSTGLAYIRVSSLYHRFRVRVDGDFGKALGVEPSLRTDGSR